MDRRYINQEVARNVDSAAAASKCSKESVARAADITGSDLDSRLAEGLTVVELVRVGGFLRIRPSAFIEGISA